MVSRAELVRANPTRSSYLELPDNVLSVEEASLSQSLIPTEKFRAFGSCVTDLFLKLFASSRKSMAVEGG